MGLCVSLFVFSQSSAEQLSPGKQMSIQERSRRMQEESENLQNQIKQKKIKEQFQEEMKNESILGAIDEQKFFVKSIRVSGISIFSNDRIRSIISQFENKALTFTEIKAIVAYITDLYRSNGYVTSRAYIPEQKMEEGSIEIRVVESRVGDVSLRGNRFYSKRLILGYLPLRKGDVFNYKELKRGLERINDHPDRNVKAVLSPGKEAGSTEIYLNVEDSFPIHISFGYNNYLSSFLRRNVYSSTLTHNNLLGRDDIMTFDYERGEANDYYSYSGHYLYPLNNNLDVGFYVRRSEQILGAQFADIGAWGSSRMYSVFGRHDLIKNYVVSTGLNFGFDYKDVYNFLGGVVSSQDRLRVAKVGLDFDLIDGFGRTILRYDFHYGIPNIIRGTKGSLDSIDTPSSRSGSDGKFSKDTLNLIRLQNLPIEAYVLWNNQFQFSSSKLTSTEQFQIGGPVNNRGFSTAEAVGDKGYSMNWELAHPLYFFPRTWKVPGTQTQIYDALRIVEFYDWSTIHLNSLQPGDEEDRTLSSFGCGAKINISKRLSAKYEIAWPLIGKSDNTKDVYQWIKMSLIF